MEPQMGWLGYVTLGIAVLGAVLGIVNTWRSFSQDRVKVRVDVVWLYTVPDLAPSIGVKVINLSSFEVTIRQVGFELHGSDATLGGIPILQSGGNLPQRLKSRAALTAMWPLGADNKERFLLARRAYALTDCGHRATGGGRQLRDAFLDLAVARAQERGEP